LTAVQVSRIVASGELNGSEAKSGSQSRIDRLDVLRVREVVNQLAQRSPIIENGQVATDITREVFSAPQVLDFYQAASRERRRLGPNRHCDDRLLPDASFLI